MPPSHSQPAHANRLAQESSPYLLQHAHNPVDWWPWCDAAFAEALQRDVPVFVSIGYSTCYWCHVMERECFESDAIAQQMNDGFVCIKVDREQRPDVDELYMTATQLLTGHGGWPMSVFVEPAARRPFFCGTYFPPEQRGQMAGFPAVLDAMSAAWRDRREDVQAQAEQLAAAVREHLAADRPPAPIGTNTVRSAVEQMLRMVDRAHGGFGSAPKFPQPAMLDLLLAARGVADDQTRAAIDDALRLTLDKMSIGGVRDQLAGGFHRYAVDATWTVPHFEKMLYDNAQLAATFARASAVYDDAFYRRVARDVLADVDASMRLGWGGFASAMDAEVAGHEGANYVWNTDEFLAALGGEDAAFAARVFMLDRGTNFRDPHHPGETASNVLRLADRPDRLADEFGLEPTEFEGRLDRVRRTLLAQRATRPQPALDDKAITAWNGMMIAGLCEGTRSLQDDRHIGSAVRGADFLLSAMRDDSGRLARTWRAGTIGGEGILEDYAWTVRALVAVHRCAPDRDGRYLDAARQLADSALVRFGDDTGRLFDTEAGRSDLFVRACSLYDGATPSGQSVMIHAWLDLAETAGDARAIEHAERALSASSGRIAEHPLGAVHALEALLRLGALDAGALDRLSGVEPPAPLVHAPPGVVEVLASVQAVQVTPDEPAALTLRLDITDGFHVVAADPGPAGARLEPLRVGLARGHGVAVYADYPPGHGIASQPGVLVYTGRVEIPVAVERRPDDPGTPPVLGITFQACTDRECLLPATIDLDVRVEMD